MVGAYVSVSSARQDAINYFRGGYSIIYGIYEVLGTMGEGGAFSIVKDNMVMFI
jgi:hypothetical protein